MKNFDLKGGETLKKGLKLNRKGLSLTAALLIGATLLSGCGKTSNKYSNYNKYNNNTSTTSYYSDANDTYSTKKTYLTENELEELKEKLNSKVSINDINATAFLNYVSNVDDFYQFEELFEIDKALDKYYSTSIASAATHKNNVLNKNNQFDFNTIYTKIKENNKKYQETNNSKNGKVNFYKELDEEQLKRTCTLITEVLNSYLKNNMVNDIGELSCIVGDLKVLRDNTSFSNAYVTDDNCMLISPNMLNVMDIITSDNTFDQTVTHEIEHLLQKRCQDNLKDGIKNIGICYRYDDLEINPLFFNWLFESSAEKETCNYKYETPIVYKNMIGYLESINISTLLYNDNKALQTEKLCIGRDLDNLFSQFHCETLEDKRDVIKMMFAIDIIQNENEEFVEKYEKVTGEQLLSSDLKNIKYQLKADVCTTYLKSFYKSLTKTVSEKEIPLKDVFYLMRLTEADVYNHILYDDEQYLNYNKEFMKKAVSMQEEFFEGLNCDYSTNELSDLYKSYKLTTKNDTEITYNCDFSWLDSNKKEYIMERTDFLLEYSYTSIQEIATKQNQIKK